MKPWRGRTSARRRPMLLASRLAFPRRPRSTHLRWLERRLRVTNRPSSTRLALFYQRPRRRRAGAACACVFLLFCLVSCVVSRRWPVSVLSRCVNGAVAPLTAPCFCSQPLCPLAWRWSRAGDVEASMRAIRHRRDVLIDTPLRAAAATTRRASGAAP